MLNVLSLTVCYVFLSSSLLNGRVTCAYVCLICVVTLSLGIEEWSVHIEWSVAMCLGIHLLLYVPQVHLLLLAKGLGVHVRVVLAAASFDKLLMSVRVDVFRVPP